MTEEPRFGTVVQHDAPGREGVVWLVLGPSSMDGVARALGVGAEVIGRGPTLIAWDDKSTWIILERPDA